MKILKITCVFICVLGLTACKHRTTYRDLFLNPSLRTQLYDECQMGDEAKKQSRDCEMVFNVMSNFNIIYNQAISDGEALGQHIIELQMELKKIQQQLLLKKQALADLQKNNNDAATIQKANEELKELQKSCHQKKEEINFILAIIGTVESPE